MKWKTKQIYDTRVVRKFVLIPRSFGGTTYWLEWLDVVEIYGYWRDSIFHSPIWGERGVMRDGKEIPFDR